MFLPISIAEKDCKWLYREIVMKFKKKEKRDYFEYIEISSGQPESELVRVPGLMSMELWNEITIRFLNDVSDSEPTAQISLLNQNSSEVVIEYYWNNYKTQTILFLMVPYII